jgi:type IV pilus assembly protein PilM
MDARAAIQESVLETRRSPVAVAEGASAVSAAVGREVSQAVSVAGAYYEDTLGSPPDVLLSAGTLPSEQLAAVLAEYGMDDMRVREIVDAQNFTAGAATHLVPRGWLAGVRGALRS